MVVEVVVVAVTSEVVVADSVEEEADVVLKEVEDEAASCARSTETIHDWKAVAASWAQDWATAIRTPTVVLAPLRWTCR
jgi:hypothetical protein